MFTYNLHRPGRDDLGEATYPHKSRPERSSTWAAADASRVLDLVLFDGEDESKFVGLLQVEAA